MIKHIYFEYYSFFRYVVSPHFFIASLLLFSASILDFDLSKINAAVAVRSFSVKILNNVQTIFIRDRQRDRETARQRDRARKRKRKMKKTENLVHLFQSKEPKEFPETSKWERRREEKRKIPCKQCNSSFLAFEISTFHWLLLFYSTFSRES